MSPEPNAPLGAFDAALTRRSLACGAAASLLVAAARAGAAPQPVRNAAEFIDSIGVGTHLTAEPYSTDYPRFRTLLAESGIRHVREELREANNLDRWRDLQAATGIRWQLVVSPSTNTVPQMMERLNALGAENFTAVEGQNEGDGAWFQAQKVANGDWAATVVNYQRALYQAIRQRYSVDTLKVASPTLLDWKPGDVAAIRDSAASCDIVALHSYVQRGQEPETRDDHAALAWYIRNYRDSYKPGAPFMVTETGYTNVAKRGGLSELATSIYLPRLLLQNFAAGALRTFIYEFMDGGIDPMNNEHHYGMIRFDGSPKPSYRAVSALLHAVRDEHLEPVATAARRPPIPVGFPDAPEDLCRVLLTRRDGSIIVAVWRPLSAWSVLFGSDIANAPVPMTISTDPSVTGAALFEPNGDATWKRLSVTEGRIALNIADRVVLVKLERHGG